MSDMDWPDMAEVVHGHRPPFDPLPDRVPPLPDPPEPFSWRGYRIAAGAFDAASFERAIGRAFADGLTATPGRTPGTWLVANPARGTEYVVGPYGCTCKASARCKHEALYRLMVAIRGP